MVESGGTSAALLLGGLILLAALAAIILVGTAIYVVRARSRARTERTPLPTSASLLPRAEDTAPSPPTEDVGEPPQAVPLNPPGGSGEVMRVIRDVHTGRILVEVGERRYTHIREIDDPQVGRRVLWAIADLIRFTGGMAANAQAVCSAAQQAAEEQGLPIPQTGERSEDGQPPIAKDAAAEPGLPESHPPAPPTPTTTAAPALPDQGRGAWYSISAFFRRGLQLPPTSASLPASGSFVDEIESILQDLIGQRATPLPHEVHVSIGPEEHLQVKVGREVYDSADEVPDPEVQALIRAAVAEWEKR